MVKTSSKSKKNDMRKTKAQLVDELRESRRQAAQLQERLNEQRGAGEAPTQQELLLRTLLSSTPDHIYFKDTESRFLAISKTLAKHFGIKDPAEALGKTDFDFFSDEHARQAYDDEQRIMRTGEALLNAEEKETWPDRPDTWVLTSKMPLRDAEGNVVGTFGFSRDITQRRHAELRLEHRAVQLQAAAEISRAASSILDLDELIRQVVNLLRERFDLYYAGLFLVDETGRWAVLRAGTGEAGQKMLEQGHRLQTGSESMIGSCISSRQARIALDVGEQAVRFENPLLPETRSELALPLVSRNYAVGALTIQSAQEAAFSEEDIAVFQTMADQVASAIANARLVERTESQLRELNRLYAEYSAAAWAQMTSGERPLGYEYDHVRVSPVADSSAPALDMALARGETVAASDAQTTGSVLAVPLKVRGNVIGVIGVQESDGARDWSPEEIALVEELGDQIAIALDSARLFNEARTHAEELTVLNELAQGLAASATLEEVCEQAYQGASRLLHTANFSVGLYDPERFEVNFVFDESQSEEDRELSTIRADQGLTGYIIQNRKSVLINERLSERLEELGVESIGGDALSWLGVPLLVGDAVLGMMAVQDYTTPNAYDEHDRELLMAIASQTATALQRSRLFQQTEDRAQRERQIYEISDRLRRSPSMATILQTAVDELGRALQTDRAMVRLGVMPREESQASENPVEAVEQEVEA